MDNKNIIEMLIMIIVMHYYSYHHYIHYFHDDCIGIGIRQLQTCFVPLPSVYTDLYQQVRSY